jgi:hypothetical protein
MFWKTRCFFAWLLSLIAIFTSTVGIILTLWLAQNPPKIFVDVYENPLATFGLMCLPVALGLLIHIFGMVITQTDSWFPKFNKNPA